MRPWSWGQSIGRFLAPLAILCAAALLAAARFGQTPAEALGLSQGTWTLYAETGGVGVEALALASTDGQVILAGTVQRGLYRSANGGGTWSVVLDRAVTVLATAPSDPSTVYAGTLGDGVLLSQDGGATWMPRSTGLLADDVYALAVDPSNAQVVVAGTEVGAFTTTNGGMSWQAASEGLTGRSVHALTVVDTTWIAGGDTGAFRSTDGGQSWAPANQGLLGTQVHALALAGNGTIWAGTNLGVCYGTDRGQSWVATSGGLPQAPVLALAVNPSDPQELYAGGGHGVYATGNGGSTWLAWSEGLTGWALQVKALLVDTSADPVRLMAGTGAGVWVRDAQVAAEWRVHLPLIRRQYLPVQQPTPTSTPEGLLYFDDFSDPNSGWYVGETNTAKYAYVDGEYQILVKIENGSTVLHAPTVRCADCSVEVEARLATAGVAAYGLQFAASDDNYYLFRVSHSQQYELWKVIGGTWEQLVGWTSSAHINAGQAMNRLRVVHNGADIVLYANDQHLTTLSDDSLSGEGLLGVHARTWSSENVDVRFDNFTVSSVTDGYPTATPTPTQTQIPTQTPTPTTTAVQTPTPTATQPTGPVLLYADDFGDPQSGWPVTDEADKRYGYVDGEYVIHLKQAQLGQGLAAPGFRCADCAIEVDGRFVSPVQDAYGIAFGITSDWDRYVFMLRGEGKYSLWKKRAGAWQALVPWTSSPYVNPGSMTNHLRVVRSGADIVMYANGWHLNTISDDTFTGSLRVGLYAEVYDDPDMEVRFDNFAVYSAYDVYPTATPVQTPQPTPMGRLYFDDFSDPASGWLVDDDDSRRYAYVDGEYQIWLKTASLWRAVTRGFRCTDCAIEVDGRFASSAYGAYGIMFGITDDWHGYVFRVNAQQEYSLFRFTDQWDALVDWTASPALNAGQAVNHLRTVRDGSDIALYANGQHLATTSDDALTGSLRVGLYARAVDVADVDARFDNLAVHAVNGGAGASAVDLQTAASDSTASEAHGGTDRSP